MVSVARSTREGLWEKLTAATMKWTLQTLDNSKMQPLPSARRLFLVRAIKDDMRIIMLTVLEDRVKSYLFAVPIKMTCTVSIIELSQECSLHNATAISPNLTVYLSLQVTYGSTNFVLWSRSSSRQFCPVKLTVVDTLGAKQSDAVIASTHKGWQCYVGSFFDQQSRQPFHSFDIASGIETEKHWFAFW